MRPFLLLLLLLASGCADQSCRLDKLAELPLTLQTDVPVVAVTINGKPAQLVLDTGSDATVLTRIAARRLGIVDAGQTQTIGGAGGQERVGVAQVAQLGIGGLVVPDVKVLLANAPAPPLDGLLGINVLVGYELELDAPHGRLALYRARPCVTAVPDWPGEIVRLPMQQQARSGHLFVPVTVDGEPLRAMMDTGASVTTLSIQAAEDVRISARRLAGLPALRGQAVNTHGIILRRQAFRELRVGTDVVEAPQLAITDLPPLAGDLLLGGDYLATRRVWFSFLLGAVFVAH